MKTVPTTTAMCLVWYPRMAKLAAEAYQIDSCLRYSRKVLYPDKDPSMRVR